MAGEPSLLYTVIGVLLQLLPSIRRCNCYLIDLVVTKSPATTTSNPRGSGSACESDGDDSDGQGAPQGGGGVQSTPVSARAAEILRGLRGLEAIFMRK